MTDTHTTAAALVPARLASGTVYGVLCRMAKTGRAEAIGAACARRYRRASPAPLRTREGRHG